jgi:NADPH:quinone reductase-like Zn-dependent oxidoreductase
MLITNAQLQPGETVLIIGVGGGVASASLQVAKKIGAHVIITAGSDEKLDRAKQLGRITVLTIANRIFLRRSTR